MQERDETIQDKEKRIYDLKQRNQELEKFRFVLDYKIKELRHQIEPRESEIAELSSKITDMDGELEQYHRINTDLECVLEDLKFKVKTSEGLIKQEKDRSQLASGVVKRFKMELTQCMSNVKETHIFKRQLRELYQKYCQGINFDHGSDTDVQLEEFKRQRAHMEHSIATMRQKYDQRQVAHRLEKSRMIAENMTVIQEINELRRST